MSMGLIMKYIILILLLTSCFDNGTPRDKAERSPCIREGVTHEWGKYVEYEDRVNGWGNKLMYRECKSCGLKYTHGY